MKNTKLTISELEKLTGINRRTIHFYVKKRMLPPPEGLGGGARYGEASYLRLVLIKELQKSHLKLSGIKEALDEMPMEEMRTHVDSAKNTPHVENKLALDNHLQGIVSSALSTGDVMPDEGVREALTNNFSLLKIGSKKKKVRDGKDLGTSYLNNLKRHRRKELPESTWTRVFIDDGIELNIRSDVQKKYNREIARMIQNLKKNSPKGGR
jgi:DNA-binding transcriptional MerR regulator